MKMSKRRISFKAKSKVKSRTHGGIAYPVIYGAEPLLSPQENRWRQAVESGLKPPKVDPDLAEMAGHLSVVDKLSLAAKFARWSAMLTDQVRYHQIYADRSN